MFNMGKLFNNDTRINDSLSAISFDSIKTLSDIKIFGQFPPHDWDKRLPKQPNEFSSLDYSNHPEGNIFHQKKSTEDWWKYNINYYNFRDEWDFSDTSKPKIAFFGDSFTFCDGISSENTHPNYIRNLIDVRTYNVGKGGASTERIARIFSVFAKFVEHDIAVITLPHIHREYFMDDRGFLTDLIPNVDQKNEHYKYMIPFFGLHENYQKIKLSFCINHILTVANFYNIKVLFNTWDIPTFQLLKVVASDHLMKDVFPQSIDNLNARDRLHPGPLAQHQYANDITKELYDRAWI